MPHKIDFSKYYDNPVRGRIRGLLAKQSLKEIFEFQLIDYENNPLNIKNVAEEHSLPGYKAVVSYKEASDLTPIIYYDDATIVDADIGLIKFSIPEEVSKVPAVYIAEIAICNPEETNNNVIYAHNSLYIYNEPTHWTTDVYTLPPMSDIRLSLRDSDFIENELIDNYDYDVAEISYATARTVKYWNELPPPVAFYTTSKFPFRNIWFTGIQLFLFEMIEEHYRRNYFPYSLGGMSIDDKNKFQIYNAAFQDRFKRFRADVMAQKIRINTELATGSVEGFKNYGVI